MENTNVALPVLERLKLALRLVTDTQLAEALGLSVQALNKRKLRGSLPTDEIDTLVERHGLSSAWVYGNHGPMFEGGEAEAARVADYRELVGQLDAMRLHNATRDAVEKLLRGVVWGDPAAIEKVIEQLTAMNVKERDLLDNYRNADPDMRAAIERVMQGMPAAKAIKQTFHGEVGQLVNGNISIPGGMKISMNEKTDKKRK